MTIDVLLPSRKDLKASRTSSSDLATSLPHFHSCRISGSKFFSNVGSIKETKSEVRTQKNIPRTFAAFKFGLADHKTDGF